MTPDNGWNPPPASGYAPPPPGYGYPPAPGPGYPPVFAFAPLPPLATWPYRVAALLIDQIVPGLLGLVGLAIWLPGYIRFIRALTESAAANGGHAVMAATPFGPGYLTLMLLSLAGFGFSLWNRTFRQGRTGQSLGKQLLGLRLLSERTMAPVGAGTAFLRELAHYLDGAVMDLGYLWPLWDHKRQTFADKICGTVVVVDGSRRR